MSPSMNDDVIFHGGGEMGALMRAHDWAAHPLGPPAGWPAPLRTVVRLMLTTRHPMYVWWSRELYCFYNDAYRRSVGRDRHPSMLGARGREVWDEIWDVIGPQIDHVLAAGGATWNENHLVPITRDGVREQVYWTYSYSPIDDPSAPNGVGGVLVICNETTEQVTRQRDAASAKERAEIDAQELRHRMKNNTATIAALIAMEARRLSDPKATAALGRISDHLAAFSAIYEVMLVDGAGDQIDLARFLDLLGRALRDLHQRPDVSIELTVAVDPVSVAADQATAMAAIISELVTNAYRYAFPDRQSGAVRVELRRHGGFARLSVEDDGCGFDDARSGASGSTGMGQRLVELYTAQLGGRMDRRTGPAGTRHTLTFPLAVAAPPQSLAGD